MTTLSSFRINQPPATLYPNWDRARRDIQLFADNGSVECEAFEKFQTSYKWELISLPEGVTVAIVNGTTHTCHFDIVVRGSYLVRLTVNEGSPSQYKTTLFFGVPMEGSNLCLPAHGETNQDNSQSPYDGSRGSGGKQAEITQWVEKRNSPWVRTKSANYLVTEADDGLTLVPTVDGLEFTLPPCRNGLRTTVMCPLSITAKVICVGTDVIVGGWTSVSGNSWTDAFVDPGSTMVLEGIKVSGVTQWSCRSEGRIQDANSSEQWYSGTGTVEHSGSSEIHVDAYFGSDTNGDGTEGNPYQTLPYSCLQQVDPTGPSEFIRPITFVLGRGTYTGTVTLPQRLHIKIVGDDCNIDGDILWPIKPDWWADWFIPLSNVPVLNIARRESILGKENASGVGIGMVPQGFRLGGGAVIAYNGHTGTAKAMPDNHLLIINGVVREGYSIYNRPAGTGVESDAPGPMVLVLRDSSVVGGGAIAGEVDRLPANGSSFFIANEVKIYAERSDVYMLGVCKIASLNNCQYFADRTLNLAEDPYAYGLICGDVPYPTGGHIQNSMMIAESYFGCDPAAPAPSHFIAMALIFDRDSLLSMTESCSDLAASFYGFNSGFPPCAFGRGWFYGCSEASEGSRLTIPNANPDSAWKLFAHTYSYSDHWRPNGGPLSLSNRLTIELETGSYALPKPTSFDFDKEFVDVVGRGASVKGSSRTSSPSVVFVPGTNEMGWLANDARLESVQFMQSAGAGEIKYCLTMKSQASYSVFKNLSFVADPFVAGEARAVLIDPALAPLAVRGTWEDCNTILNGFLFGGSFEVTAKRCNAGSYSFAAWGSGDTVKDVICSGYLEDCSSGSYSFGSVFCWSTGGGNGTFRAVALRCRATTSSFAHVTTPVGAYTATCEGTLTDCDNYSTGGLQSFGYSSNGDALVTGYFFRCSSGPHSFGVSNGANGTFAAFAYNCSSGHHSFGNTGAHAGIGTFAGQAFDCVGLEGCFGGSSHDPINGLFTGTAERCIAGYQSFGARGEFTGTARDCRASYGSFGDTTTFHKGKLIRCEATDFRAAAGQGPPGIFGALVRGCLFTAKAGENIPALVINGGLATAGEESRVFDCDLYSAVGANCIYAAAPADAQITHCRMNTDLHANVTNVITDDPCNVVDAAYDPT